MKKSPYKKPPSKKNVNTSNNCGFQQNIILAKKLPKSTLVLTPSVISFGRGTNTISAILHTVTSFSITVLQVDLSERSQSDVFTHFLAYQKLGIIRVFHAHHSVTLTMVDFELEVVVNLAAFNVVVEVATEIVAGHGGGDVGVDGAWDFGACHFAGLGYFEAERGCGGGVEDGWFRKKMMKNDVKILRYRPGLRQKRVLGYFPMVFSSLWSKWYREN